MPISEINLWEAILRPHFGQISLKTAKSILDLSIPDEERVRMKSLLEKAKEGTISREEVLDLDEYERVGNVLSILKARARGVVKSKQSR